MSLLSRSRLVVLAATGALALAACGADDAPTDPAGSERSPAASPSPASNAALQVADSSLGQILVDADGMTLYMLTSDEPGTSLCDAECLTSWPPVAPPSETSFEGISAEVGEATTPEGDPIVTVGDWPLYTYVEDQAPGDVTGQGVESFGGVWYVIGPDGEPIEDAADDGGDDGGDDDSGDPGGYGY